MTASCTPCRECSDQILWGMPNSSRKIDGQVGFKVGGFASAEYSTSARAGAAKTPWSERSSPGTAGILSRKHWAAVETEVRLLSALKAAILGSGPKRPVGTSLPLGTKDQKFCGEIETCLLTDAFK